MDTNVSVRRFRTTLAAFLKGSQAVVIGDRYHNRAILIPLGVARSWQKPEQRKAIAHAAKEMLRILALLRAESRR
jgi:hypothetical protein